MSNNSEIYEELTPDELIDLQKQMKNEIVIIKFGASWCKPCEKIKKVCSNYFNNKLPSNVIKVNIDVDDYLDLYGTLKTKKMVSGLPTILCYYSGVERTKWFIPDDSVSGGDEEKVKAFFERCILKASSLK